MAHNDYRKPKDLKREDFIASARINKALLIVDAIEEIIVVTETPLKDLVKSSYQTRSTAAQIAQELRKRETGVDAPVHVPSEHTWALAIKIYRRRIKERQN